MTDRRSNIRELQRLLEQPRPKGVEKSTWLRRQESIRTRLRELKTDPAAMEAGDMPSSNAMRNRFWQVSNDSEMRHSLGQAWGVNTRGNGHRITDFTKHSDVPTLFGDELRAERAKRKRRMRIKKQGPW